MKNYILNVRVNEDVVKEVSGEDDLESAIKAEAGWMHDSGIYLESIKEVSEKCILVSTDRMDLDIATETFSSRKAAYEELSTAKSELVHASTEDLIDELKRCDLRKPREFDIVLLEKPGNDGLSIKEVVSLYGLMPNGEALAYPFEINGESSTAEGFITESAADELDFKYDQASDLGVFVSSILKNMEKESEDGTYEFKGLRIWMRRNI